MPESLLEMAKALVMVQIETQRVGPETLSQALRTPYQTLCQLQHAEAAGATGIDAGDPSRSLLPEAVNWKSRMTKHAAKYLECGATLKQLSRHYLQQHDLYPRSYHPGGPPHSRTLWV
jgi:predicted transcriptional regulator